MRILVAEDDPDSRKLLCTILKIEGWEVVEAEDGAIALDIIKNHENNIDILITDYMMPNLNGIELLGKVREIYPILPVIICTAIDEKEVIRKALRMGADDFLDKPLRRAKLKEAVQSVVSASRRKMLKHSLDTSQAVKEVQKTTMNSVECRQLLASDNFAFAHKSFTDAGGDFLYSQQISENIFRIFVVDVAGHDIASSYMVAHLKGLLSVLADHFINDTDKLISEINRKLIDVETDNTHVCLILLEWNQNSGRVKIVNAGLPYGYLARNNELTMLKLDGMMLGLFDNPKCDSIELQLEPQQRLILFSDGVEELFPRSIIEDTWLSKADRSLQKNLQNFFTKLYNSVQHKDDVLIIGVEQPTISQIDPKNIAFKTTMLSHLEYIDSVIDKCISFIDTTLNKQKYDFFMYSYCLREMICNAVQHGNQNDLQKFIYITIEIDINKEKIYSYIKDEGKGFSLTDMLKQEQHADDLRMRGRGIIGVYKIASSLSYSNNQLKFIFDISDKQPHKNSC